MKAIDIIAELDKIDPNQYGNELKLGWLRDLDGKIFRELIETHCDCETKERYTAADYRKGDVVLLIVEPYAHDVYLNYLRSKIAEANAETERYNLYASAFNAAYQEYAAWYNRTTRPKRQRGWRY